MPTVMRLLAATVPVERHDSLRCGHSDRPWTAHLDRVHQAAQVLEAGMIWVSPDNMQRPPVSFRSMMGG